MNVMKEVDSLRMLENMHDLNLLFKKKFKTNLQKKKKTFKIKMNFLILFSIIILYFKKH
jgi:hypothetical protein